jgi:hypothetical protein
MPSVGQEEVENELGARGTALETSPLSYPIMDENKLISMMLPITWNTSCTVGKESRKSGGWNKRQAYDDAKGNWGEGVYVRE